MKDVDYIGIVFGFWSSVFAFLTNPFVYFTLFVMVIVHDVRGHNRMWKQKAKAKKRRFLLWTY